MKKKAYFPLQDVNIRTQACLISSYGLRLWCDRLVSYNHCSSTMKCIRIAAQVISLWTVTVIFSKTDAPPRICVVSQACSTSICFWEHNTDFSFLPARSPNRSPTESLLTACRCKVQNKNNRWCCGKKMTLFYEVNLQQVSMVLCISLSNVVLLCRMCTVYVDFASLYRWLRKHPHEIIKDKGSTFCAVRRVVQRWWLAIVVWWYLHR